MKQISHFIAVGIFCLSSISCGIFNKTTDNSTLISKEEYSTENTTSKIDNAEKTTVQSTTIVKKENKEVESTKRKTKTKNKKNKDNKSTERINQNNTFSISTEIINGKWIINSVNGIQTSGDDRPYIIFDEATKQMYANNGCNTLNAEYNISDKNLIKFNNVLSTQRYCHDAKFETEINNAISNVYKISLTQNGNEYYLDFLKTDGTNLMTLRKANLEFIDGIWKITEINGNSSKLKNKNYELALDITEMKLHGNIGCNTVNGTILLDATKNNSITFLDLRSTKMSCPDTELELEILIALESVEKYRKEDDKTLYLYDKNGKKLLELINTSNKYKIK